MPTSGAPLKAAWGYGLTLAALITFVIVHTIAVERRLAFVSSIPMGPATTAAIDRGEALPRLPQVRALDSFLWIDHAKSLAHTGSLRLRSTDFDNAPEGRSVRWHSGLALWLVALGRVWSEVGGISVDQGIERAAVWACPLLFLGAALFFSFLTYRRWGALAASTLALAMLASGDFYGGFLPGEPDHHGLAAACALGTLLGILMANAGWIESPATRRLQGNTFRNARTGMIVSAASASAGLWISAVSQTLVFVAIGIGFLCLLIRRSPAQPGPHSSERATAQSAAHSGAKEMDVVFSPELWRFWGRLGAVLALAFYVLEYLPDAWSWRVEANHPLYALAWLSGGELIAGIGSITHRRQAHARSRLNAHTRPADASAGPTTPNPQAVDAERSGNQWPRLIAAAIGVALPAIVVALGGSGSHALRDPFLQQLHGMIIEFMPFVTSVRDYGGGALEAIGFTPLVLIAGIVLLATRRLDPSKRRVLTLALGAVAVATVARFYQTRWGSVWGGLLVAMTPMIVVYSTSWLRERFGPAGAAMLGVIVLAVAMIMSPWRILASDRAYAAQTEELSLDELHALVLREVAYRLHEARGSSDRPIVVLTGPDSTVRLLGFGRDLQKMSGLGTLYWENADGLRAAAQMITASDEAEARHLLQTRRVTHILLVEWEDFTSGYYELLHPERGLDASLASTFGRRIANPSTRPAWLSEVPVDQVEEAKEMRLRVLLLAVEP